MEMTARALLTRFSDFLRNGPGRQGGDSRASKQRLRTMWRGVETLVLGTCIISQRRANNPATSEPKPIKPSKGRMVEVCGNCPFAPTELDASVVGAVWPSEGAAAGWAELLVPFF